MTEAAQMATTPGFPRQPPRGSADARAGGDGATVWQGPFRRRGIPRPFSWATILWNMILPHRGARTLPTAAGMLLLALAVAIAVAAYNTASNILFITLSLLLSCLLLHGILDFLNFRRLSWRLIVKPPLRAGEESLAAIEVRNDKRVLPTHAIWFQTAALRSGLEGLLPLPGRLGPGGEARAEWPFTPARRGVERVELTGAVSRFPFGFARKTFAAGLRRDVRVWPARVDYELVGVAAAARRPAMVEISRAGDGSDLHNLRRYRAGDSHRHIHWKASARLGQLLVKQNAAESTATFILRLDATTGAWTRPEQFERACSLAATLAEDLFRDQRLAGVALNDEDEVPVRGLADLEGFLDRLATIEPGERKGRAVGPRPAATIMIEPDVEGGALARLGGEIAARA
jgi:uncharacterized protein (DUF58 family)